MKEQRIDGEQVALTPLPTQKPSLQVIENMQLKEPARKEPEVIPITMDLGGIQNLIVQEFMRIHGWMERDLQRLRTLSSENKELARQIQEETLRLLKTQAVSDEPCKLMEEDLIVAEEFARLDDAWLLRVQKVSKELHATHGRLQALLDAFEGANIESGIQSITLDDIADIKPLDPESSLTDIRARLEQLRGVAGHLNTRLDRLQGNYSFRGSDQAPIRGISQHSRDLLKAKLLKRPVSPTVISESTAVSAAPPIQPVHPANLLTIRKVLAARNQAALASARPEEVTAVAEALPKQDTLIFKFSDAASKSPPEQTVKTQEPALPSAKPLLGAPIPSKEASAGEKLVFGAPLKLATEVPTRPEKPAATKFEFAVPSTSSTDAGMDRSTHSSSAPSAKSGETTSTEPLLPKTGIPIFPLVPPLSPFRALSLSPESTTLKSSETAQESEGHSEVPLNNIRNLRFG